jgi:hypothetical protein
MIGKYRLLVLDGHGSHLTPEFNKICGENNDIPICMSAHSSNYLQPLDVSVFSPLNIAYGGLVRKKMQCGINHINKLDFIKIYLKAHQQAFTANNIKSCWTAE